MIIKENLISDPLIFYRLRNAYPEHSCIIGELLKYSLIHKDSFDDQTYLDGTFSEHDVKFIFSKLNLPILVKNVLNTTLRSKEQTILQLEFVEPKTNWITFVLTALKSRYCCILRKKP